MAHGWDVLFNGRVIARDYPDQHTACRFAEAFMIGAEAVEKIAGRIE